MNAADTPAPARPGRIVLLTTSHRVAPGLLSWPAWQALREADRVLCADPGHPRLPEVRHLLAYYLALQDRDAAAVEQFRLVDGHVGALPWRRYRPSPAASYCKLRDASVLAAG